MEERISSLGAIKEAKEESKILEKMQQEHLETPKPVKYKRADTFEGYLTDEVEIDAFKVSQNYDIIFNNMLGNYDEDGEYIIENDVLEALINCHKHITRAYADTLYLLSYQKFGDKGHIEFTLSFVKNNEGKQIAVLKVLEPVNKVGGYLINTHSIVVGTYTDVNDEMYMTKVKKAFHIYDSEEDGGKEDLEKLNAITKRLEMLAKMRALVLKNLAKDEEQYFNQRLEALKDVKFEEIMQEFEALKNKAEMFLNPTSSFFFYYMNQLLDIALYNTKFKNPELYKEAMVALKDVIKNYSHEMAEKFNQYAKEAQMNEQAQGQNKSAWKEPNESYWGYKIKEEKFKQQKYKALDFAKPGEGIKNEKKSATSPSTSNIGKKNTAAGKSKQEQEFYQNMTRDLYLGS